MTETLPLTKQGRLWAMVAVMLVAFGLRVWLLADTNLNWDEGYSAWISRLSLPVLADTTARDVHPPLYYLTLSLGTAAFGNGEFGLRFGSVIVGLLMVALTYRFGRAVGGDAVGIIAALLLALARSNVHISQLARMHILAAALATLALWGAVILWRNPRHRVAWVGVVIGTAGALYTFYLTIMLPLAVNAAFLVVWARRHFDRKLLLSWVGTQVTAALLFLPWAIYASARMFGWSSDEITPPLFFTQFYISTLTVGRPTFNPSQLPYVGAYLTVLIAGLIALIGWMLTETHSLPPMGGARRHNTTGLGMGVHHADRLVLLLSGVLTPAIVVFLLSLPFHDLGRPLAARYMLPLSACFYVLTAWGIVSLYRWQRAIGAIGLAVTVAVAGWGMANIADGAIRRDDMHSVALTLEALRQEGDAVILHNDKTWTSLAAHFEDDFMRIPQAEDITEQYAEELLSPVRIAHPGVWLVTTPAAAANDPTGRIGNWLFRNSMIAQSWTFGDHQLSFYTYSTERATTLNVLTLNAAIPTEYAHDDIGLLGVERPLQRYAVGDRVNLALYWDQPPSDPFTVAFVSSSGVDTITHEVAAPDPSPDGPTRQQLTLPIAPGTTAGRYQLRLQIGDGQHDLGPMWVVDIPRPGIANANQIETPLDVTFRRLSETEPLIALDGYTLPRDSVRAGRILDVTLYWRALQPLPERYKISVFLLGDEVNPATGNPLYAQVDTEPVNWTLPTTLWEPDTLIGDPYALAVPADVPPGTYQLGVVVYNPNTSERLWSDNTDMALLTPITIR